jgi:hypothetical protein
MFGCLDVWMFGCLDVWMFGCLDVWMFGCLDVWIILDGLKSVQNDLSQRLSKNSVGMRSLVTTDFNPLIEYKNQRKVP